MANLNINGKKISVAVDPNTPLLWAIRDHIGLTGTKYGCGVGQCGACTVLFNGEPLQSCAIPVSAAEGKKIETIENQEVNDAPMPSYRECLGHLASDVEVHEQALAHPKQLQVGQDLRLILGLEPVHDLGPAWVRLCLLRNQNDVVGRSERQANYA